MVRRLPRALGAAPRALRASRAVRHRPVPASPQQGDARRLVAGGRRARQRLRARCASSCSTSTTSTSGSCCASTRTTPATSTPSSTRRSTASSTTGSSRSGSTATSACASCISVPYDHPELAVAEIERRAGDDRFVQVLLPAGGAGAVRLAQVLAGLRAAADARPAGRVPHRRLHGPPRRGLAVVLPRGARGLRRRHADAADEPRLRGHVRRDPGPQGRAHRGRRAVGRRAALAAGRGVVAAARRGARARAAAVGVHPRPRLVRHPADGGARRPGALPADRSSRPTSRTG